jgi:1-aminocyclopropane-1-carboxylate deaminase/D-cysteine desulfhydrase-like pyridoxal-dependent ACC family enzyme
MLGCDVYLVQKDGEATDAELQARAVTEVMEKYKSAGDIPYFIPMGGSNPLGCLGYYECAQEITKQAEELNLKNARIVCTIGSEGTYMGFFLGLKETKSPIKLKGVVISPWFDPDPSVRTQKYFDECKEYFKLDWDASKDDFDITTQYHCGGYNNPVKEVREAIYYVAKKEAIILDPCYTGKCFYGLMEMVKSGEIKKGENIIFIHTGGTAGINGPVHRKLMEEDLKDGLIIKKPAK